MSDNTRIKRILFRSTHRGTKEADLLLGPYANAHIHTMPQAELEEFEQFLEESDSDIWDWISGAAVPAHGRYGQLIEKLRKLHAEETNTHA